MPLRVRLLGRPGLEHDGESRRLEGHKPWALLTYLLLEPRAPTRRELADLLWSETDDPLGAVRWSLSQVRKAINPPAEIGERDGRIKIDAEVLVVDAGELLRGEWDESSIDDLVRGELLEGMSFGEAPSFDTWLQVQRARVATAAADALRWAATLLSHREPDRALALAERALRSEPFDDGLHELVVEIHTARGDRGQRESRRADLLRNEEGMTSETVDEPEDENRRSEGNRDRKASRPRDRTRVAPTPARHVEHAQSPREDPDEGSRDRGQREREQGRTDKENGRGGHRGHDNDSHAFGIPALTDFLDSARNDPSGAAPWAAGARA